MMFSSLWIGGSRGSFFTLPSRMSFSTRDSGRTATPSPSETALTMALVLALHRGLLGLLFGRDGR